MASKSGFVRLNLVQAHATRVVFSYLFGKGGNEQGAEELSDLLENEGFTSFTKYRRSSKDHMLFESVNQSNPGRGPFVYVVYDASDGVPSGPLPKDASREGILLERLEKSNRSYNLACDAVFHFDEDTVETSGLWFPLPLSLPVGGGDGTIVTEIRGIRGVRRLGSGEGQEHREDEDAEGVSYSFILDRPTNRDLFLSVDFPLVTTVSRDTPADILAKARTIVRELGLS